MKPAHSRASTFFALGLSVVSSVSLVLVNKYLLSTLMFPYGAQRRAVGVAGATAAATPPRQSPLAAAPLSPRGQPPAGGCSRDVDSAALWCPADYTATTQPRRTCLASLTRGHPTVCTLTAAHLFVTAISLDAAWRFGKLFEPKDLEWRRVVERQPD